MIDFHCHLDLYPDHKTAVDDRESQGVYTLSVTTTPAAWPQNRDFTSDKKYVRAALGLHPQVIAERASEITLWKKYLSEARYIGEVGLDGGPAHYKSLNTQKKIFEEILKSCSEVGGKILSVHSVRTSKDILEAIDRHLPQNRGRVVLHWFTGTKKQIQQGIELGCLFSFNVDMLQTESGRTTASIVPIDRILTETDAPFTKTPDIAYAMELLAEIKRIPTNELDYLITRNARSLLS